MPQSLACMPRAGCVLRCAQRRLSGLKCVLQPVQAWVHLCLRLKCRCANLQAQPAGLSDCAGCNGTRLAGDLLCLHTARARWQTTRAEAVDPAPESGLELPLSSLCIKGSQEFAQPLVADPAARTAGESSPMRAHLRGERRASPDSLQVCRQEPRLRKGYTRAAHCTASYSPQQAHNNLD